MQTDGQIYFDDEDRIPTADVVRFEQAQKEQREKDLAALQERLAKLAEEGA